MQPNRIKRFLTALLLTGSMANVYSQDLHVFYDVFADTIYYQQDGKALSQATVKKGQQVILHVMNYNDYIYDLELETETQDYQLPASGGLPFGAGSNPQMLAQLRSLTGGIGGAGFGLDSTRIADQGLGMVDQSAVSNATRALARRFAGHLESMQDIEEEIQELTSYLDEELKNQELQRIALSEVKKLRQHPGLSPKKIKKLSMGYLESSLGLQKKEALDIGEVTKRTNLPENLEATAEDYEAEVGRLQLELQKLTASKNVLLEASDLPGPDRAALSVAYESAALRASNYESQANTIREQLAALESLQLQELVDLSYLYEEMEEHRFEKKFVLKPNSDLTTLRIKLTPVDSARLQGVRPQTLNPVSLTTHGGLKVNASVGVSFVRFFDRPQSYYVRDSMIIADDEDAFSPIISSFFHFYPQSRRQVSVGGTFGLGIGVGGENAGLQTYFFGPSLILGKEQRIVFTTGLAGGKVERLAQGYTVGDAYDATVIPTKSVYELGYFVGVSFNLIGN